MHDKVTALILTIDYELAQGGKHIGRGNKELAWQQRKTIQLVTI
jgi:hypothetical protein